MARPLRGLVLGDLHLVRHTPKTVTDDLAALLAKHAGERVIVAGDLFDLSSDHPPVPHARAIADALGAHPGARAALARHVDTGGELWLVGGNHDADLGADHFTESLLKELGIKAEARARVRVTPWFFQDGGLYVEHGHLYDPDNAPAHPLVLGEPSLGVHFVQDFIAPTGAHRYLQANDETPLKLFLSSFTWYGPRAPHVIYRYFHTAITAMLRSGPFYRAKGEAARGDSIADALAEQLGVPRATLDALIGLGAKPTMESLSRTFTRLYFDRVLGTIALGLGAGAAAMGKLRFGATAAGLGALLLGASWSLGHNRYGGTVHQLLREGARKVASVTGAKLVVFGHTHQAAHEGGYANTGSFAFPKGAPGRPYLILSGDSDTPRAEPAFFRA
jgi:hypothetical protein